MKRAMLGLAATAMLSACGGGTNPFNTGDGTDGGTGSGITIPENLASDLDSVAYDPDAGTLVISGLSLDDTPFSATYRRRPALDREGYLAYTAQDSSLDRHVTAYVREIEDGAFAVAVATGGQFSYYFAGTHYGRRGNYSAPTEDVASGGIVSYAGTYVGLLNIAGDGGDLLPVATGTPAAVRPTQVAEVTGDAFINAGFRDNVVNGTIYNRQIQPLTDGAAAIDATTLNLAPTTIEANGTFAGDTSIEVNGTRTVVGEYGGIFAGTDATSVAGSVRVSEHLDGFNGEEEFGIFVLGQCGTASSSDVCNQPVP
ncbi:thymidylate synthase [Phaeobacter italicus]|uniref:thymidylate synthase n=1 Tax=Phaeobacter italicus TaxID=481446 RepID=UPI001ADB7613|nr:thymidylate synthase [Phaeobacter italicus]